jgi:hypothetical protein
MGSITKGRILRPALGGSWFTRSRHIDVIPFIHIRSSWAPALHLRARRWLIATRRKCQVKSLFELALIGAKSGAAMVAAKTMSVHA